MALDIRITARDPIALDVALSVAEGEFLALVGRSGSGKTSLLRAIAGLYRPQSGRITAGAEIWHDSAAGVDMPTHKRRVGLVFQSYGLFPHMRALGNVMAALAPAGKAQQEERALALLAQVSLADLAHRYPSELSGGQQQRVAIARALARSPAVLLLDEPFSAVDKIGRRALHRQLAALREQTTVPTILVTHDIDEAVRLADRIAIMDGGTIVQSGTPEDVAQNPASELVRALVS